MVNHKDVYVCKECGSMYADVVEQIEGCEACGSQGEDLFLSTELTVLTFEVGIDG